MPDENSIVSVVRSTWNQVRTGIEGGSFGREGSLEGEILGLLDHNLRKAFESDSTLRFVPQYVIHPRDMGEKGGKVLRKGDLVIEEKGREAWRPLAGFEVKAFWGGDFEKRRKQTVANRHTLGLLRLIAANSGHDFVPFFCYVVGKEDPDRLAEKIPALMREELQDVWVARGQSLVPSTEWTLEKF